MKHLYNPIAASIPAATSPKPTTFAAAAPVFCGDADGLPVGVVAEGVELLFPEAVAEGDPVEVKPAALQRASPAEMASVLIG